MPAYIVSRLTIHDRSAFGSYLAQAPRTVARFGGKYLFRGEDVTALEGSWDDERFVILEFETAEAAWAWYRSAEYQPLREVRPQLLTARRGRRMIDPPVPPGEQLCLIANEVVEPGDYRRVRVRQEHEQ